MGKPVAISLLFLTLLTAKVNSQTIIDPNNDVNITIDDYPRVVLAMNENNHDFDGIDPHVLLFAITDATDRPTITFSTDEFAYSLEQEGTTYNVYADQSFDYERYQRFYQFNVLVPPSYHPLVTLNIINIDDEPPTLTPPQCQFDENTIYTVENSECTAIVSDPDGWLNLMTFTIDPTRDAAEDIFALEYRNPPADNEYTADVYVTVKKELDFENLTFYLFDIRAKDGASHPTTPNEVVRAMVDVNDLPDTPPEWITRITFEQFEEQSEQTFYVYAVDGDHGLNYPINYTKLWEDDEEANYISIDENGRIDVKKIDRDKDDISVYNFAIMAFEIPDAPVWNNSLNISFYIFDIDNNPPLIRWVTDGSNLNTTFDETTDKVTSLSFLENYDGNLNLSIFTKDIDTGENAQFTVQLENLDESTEDYAAAFMIVPTAGYRNGTYQIAVRDATRLDYEVDEWIHIKFNVVTRGNDPTKEDHMLVNITLENYNDELPIFENTEYEKSINETAKKGDFIIQIMATDRDAEDAILKHTLVGSTYTNRVLGIESDTGKIYVNDDNAFDYDTVNPIFVQVRATDKGNHMTTVPLTINLLDVNNKAPTISVGGPINVDENQISGTPLNTSITATDMDTTANLTAEIDWDKSYAMKNSRMLERTDEIMQQVMFIDVAFSPVDENDDTNKDININLIVNANNDDETTPDFELFDSLFISLKVTDWNTDPEFIEDKQSTSVIILIAINDINDNTPFFPEANLPEEERENRTVQENAPRGTSVGSLIAIDLDVTDTVTYDCTAQDPKFDWLDINPRTGAFTVKDGNLIDADTYKTFYFDYSCTASDNDYTHTSDPLLVHIYIIDTNNKHPSITMPNDVYVDEWSNAGTEVQKIETSDDDRDIPFHTVACTFTERTGPCFNSFNIDNNTVTVKIGGDDLNRDEGLQSYDCAVTCQDNPDKLQNNLSPNNVSISFTIHLKDINNHIPEVLTKELATFENTNKSDLIGIIIAKDIDEGDNAEIDFTIEKVVNEANEEISDLFGILIDDDDYRVNLTHKQAHLIALEDLRGKYGTYTVTILAADRGTPPNKDFYDVILEVERFNFEAPRFIFPASDNQNIVLLTVQEPNSPLVLFRSGDSKYLPDISVSDTSTSDVCEKWDIAFGLEQTLPEEDTIFILSRINPCSTQLQVKGNYDGNSVLGISFNLLLTASVKDGEPQDGEAPYSISRALVINFLDNNQKPVFSDRDWTFEFFEEDDTQAAQLPHSATYEVDDDTLPIYYYLVTPNETIASLFSVDSSTGTVSLKAKLDYETDESFEFQIVASNDTSATSNNPNSYLNVICNVIDINDNTPQWIRDVFFGAVMSGYIRNTPILTVQATDADKIDEGKLTYFINGTIVGVGPSLVNVPPDAFRITETTGEIRLNFQVDSTMSGFFEFDVTVWDVMDAYGNGPHWNTTGVRVFIITEANTVQFRFLNTIEEVQNEEKEMLQVVTNVLNYDAYTQNIDKENQNGVDLDNQTFASLYFINNTNLQAIESDIILRLVSNINIFSQLVGELRNQTGLVLWSFPSTGTGSDNLEEVLRAWLVGVSVVLGALCLILLVTFILKTRELNNRITNLTMRKFGSQESGLNRLGISAPTTNKHAIEGSNPIFNLSSDDIKKDLREFDEMSMRSGDSDLIGIEDSPEFDYRDNKINEASEYI